MYVILLVTGSVGLPALYVVLCPVRVVDRQPPVCGVPRGVPG